MMEEPRNGMGIADDPSLDASERYYGKYRGRVVGTADPDNLGQIQVQVPDVLGSVTLWAMPCVPYAGPQVGFFMLPPKGANVWVEFEAGNPDFPVWTGCFWAKGQVPPSAVSEDSKVLKTGTLELVVADKTDSRKKLKRGATLRVNVGTDRARKILGIQIDADAIDIEYADQTRVTLTSKDVQISSGKSSKVTVAGDKVEVVYGGSKVTVASARVAVERSQAGLTLAASGVVLKNGTPNVKLSASSVSINNGALEVV
jgi:uncharacterized protein involved in type VI secretion and phage assembly